MTLVLDDHFPCRPAGDGTFSPIFCKYSNQHGGGGGGGQKELWSMVRQRGSFVLSIRFVVVCTAFPAIVFTAFGCGSTAAAAAREGLRQAPPELRGDRDGRPGG